MPARFMWIMIPVLLLMGCAPAPAESPRNHENTEASASLITPEKRSLSSVLVVSGTVESSPEFILVSPAAGVVSGLTSLDTRQEQNGLIARVGDSELRLSHAGSITELLVREGETVAANIPVARVRYGGFGIPISVPAAQLFRVYEAPISARASIDSGPAGLACALVPTLPDPAPGGAGESTAPPGGSALCLLPLDAAVLATLPAKVGLNTGSVENVLTLPVAAVRGSAQTGQVSVVENKTVRIADVELGLSDGVSIEIRSGIDESTTVLPYAPGF